MAKGFEYRFREPQMTPASRGAKAPQYRRTVEQGMLIEYDLPS